MVYCLISFILTYTSHIALRFLSTVFDFYVMHTAISIYAGLLFPEDTHKGFPSSAPALSPFNAEKARVLAGERVLIARNWGRCLC